MRITEQEIEAAKRQLARMREKQANADRLNDPSLTDKDRELMKKYPRHTLEAARLIDATTAGVALYEAPTNVCKGFDYLLWQERSAK